eukprot:comp21494_c0_seq1/m.29797 comp21494_c0_seq1/g.29797  ORF comp21494_c0_seq1/g.29797 comp21494_c0_seq1/m.29797 type:complete len:164 (-) comp21494_c0_seq1:415-906(-)
MAVTLKTSAGDIKLELFCDLVPRTCENFLALCASGYYDDCKIHRNIKGFIVQMGDPTGTGKGGECIWGGTFESEFHPTLKHNARGLVSMANSRPDANGSQFFITYAKQISLDGTYPIFGRVIHGQEVLDYLEKVPVDEKYRPLQDIRIKSIKIHANPIAEGSV